jgi:outer membrane protein assembly factor BamB
MRLLSLGAWRSRRCRHLPWPPNRRRIHVPYIDSTAATFSLDAVNGEHLWRASGWPVGTAQGAVVVRTEKRLYSLDAATGNELAKGDVETPFAANDAARRSQTDGQVVTVHGKTLLFVDPSTANVKRHVELPAVPNEVIVDHTTAVIGSEDEGVLMIEAGAAQ